MADEKFDDDLFETRLETLKDTQDGIQQMSSWCLQHRHQHKKIVISWLNVFKRVRVEHRLVLFYLANDVIQYSKRKRYEFVESWATALQRATTMVRDEKVKGKILRIFKIWEQREIYSEEYLSDLGGLLNINQAKKAQPPPPETNDDFHNGSLITSVRECVDLATVTDKSFKKLPKSPVCDIEALKQQLKDKTHSEDVEKELERYVTYIEAFNKNIHAEIKSRKRVLSSLDKAIKFYASQRVEVKVVVSAYKNFGSRIKLVKKKLDDMTPTLHSPIPSPDINAPSPEREADLQLPEEQAPIDANMFKSNFNGYSSYLDGQLPFDINDFKRDEGATKDSSQPIEVIASRSDDENYNPSVDYYKPDGISMYTPSSVAAIPGLAPMPVPTVQSGYSSLARTAQQYTSILPPANPPVFVNNHNAYGPYDGSGNYHGNADNGDVYNNSGGGGNAGNGRQNLMPPPMPPAVGLSGDGSAGGGGGGGGASGASAAKQNLSDEFNSTWNMSMSWTAMNNSGASTSSYDGNSSVDTPVSPPHFEREARNAATAAIEYSEHDNSLITAQDVDHRQLHMASSSSPFGVAAKLGLSQEKTRQLDIDHRNLISLTGSPGGNDSDKKAWLSEKSFPTNNSGDIDYRTIGGSESHPLPPGTTDTSILPLNSARKGNSPQKINTNATSAGHLNDMENSTGDSRYEPTDMVVDMDMSDEDLDDIFREMNEQCSDPSTTPNNDSGSQLTADGHNDSSLTTLTGDTGRPPLLETPGEYIPSNVWETAPMASMNMPGFDMQQQQQQQQQQDWNTQSSIPWAGAGNGTISIVPPPPRPPFPMAFQYTNEYGDGSNMAANVGSGEEYCNEFQNAGAYGGGGGRGGRGRGWMNGPQMPYRNFTRPPRGGNPFYGRGGGGGGGRGAGVGGAGGGGSIGGAPGMRGNFRPKFRGKNSWI